MVEINHRFLFLEEKNVGVPVPTGQDIALRRLAEMGRGRVSVVIFRPAIEYTADPLYLKAYPPRDPYFGAPVDVGFRMVSRSDLLDRLRRWATAARNGHG
jgi:hypothetical protein